MLGNALDPRNLPLALRAIYLRESRQHMVESFDPLLPNQRLAAKFRQNKIEVKVRRPPDASDASSRPSVIVLCTFEFAYMVSKEGDGPQIDSENEHLVAEVSSTFAVEYLARGSLPSESELAPWGGVTAIVHCWPYWREHCYQALTRMSLPTVVMPMLDIQSLISSAENRFVAKKKKPPTPKKKGSSISKKS
jgi:hypothetical protein